MKAMSSRFIRCLVLMSVTPGALIGCRSAAQDSSQKTDEVVYDLRNAGDYGITAPKGIYMPNPEYSEKGRKKKINGTVLVAMVVTADGSVRDVTVIKSLEPSLDKQAIAAVNKWKFEPATKDGKPVTVRLKAEVSFRIY